MTTIRYKTINRRGEISIKEKTFKSEEAMQKWAEKQEETNEGWLGIEAYSND